MADIEAVEVLTQAKERLFGNGWCTGLGHGHEGKQEDCVGQAISGTRGGWGDACITYKCSDRDCRDPHLVLETPRQRAVYYLREVIGLQWPGTVSGPEYVPQYLWSWNDQQTSAGVIFDAIEAAIAMAKESPNPHTS